MSLRPTSTLPLLLFALAPILTIGWLARSPLRPGGAPPAFPLAGTWTLEAADDLGPDGTRVEAYGPRPGGLLIVDAEGRYSLQIFRRDRPKFLSGDKRRGSAEEYQAAVLGMSSHVGRIAMDSAAHILTFSIELASYPNWEGTVQRREYELTGDLLTYRLPAQVGSNGNRPLSSWRRGQAGS